MDEAIFNEQEVNGDKTSLNRKQYAINFFLLSILEARYVQ
jgi:hypothetical protein